MLRSPFLGKVMVLNVGPCPPQKNKKLLPVQDIARCCKTSAHPTLFAELTLKLEVSSALSCAGGQALGCSPQPGQEHNRTTQSHPARTDADGKMPQRSEEVGDGCTFMGMGGLRESRAPWAR